MKYRLFNYWLVILVVAFGLPACSQKETDENNTPIGDSTFLPTAIEEILVRDTPGFVIGYSLARENIVWVAYHLTPSELKGTVSRTDDFRADPELNGGAGVLEDYRGSGFDRGHLAPAGDMKWSIDAMSHSFLLSNIVPQLRKFNGGVWLDLERSTRRYVLNNQRSVYLVTGPIVHADSETIGNNEIPVASHFYKIIYDAEAEKAVAYLLPHLESIENFEKFAVSVDQVEQITGLDFFSSLPDSLEELMESSVGDLKFH